MIFIGELPQWIIGFGIFNPGDEIDYDETLFATGLFKKKDVLDKGGNK